MVWEYLITTLKQPVLTASLTSYGSDGWELVAVVAHGDYDTLYLKRPAKAK